MRRTDFNFDNHTHRMEYFTNEEGKQIRVDHFQNGDSRCGYVKFVNDDEGLTVYGDFGNWVFCRPFVPSEDGFVSEMYWCEKLRMYSEQEISEYDSEETAKELEEMIDHGLEDYGLEGEELEDAKEWLREILEYVDDEVEYTYHAYRTGYPPFDYEYIPFVKKLKPRLLIIFDVFELMCERIKEKNLEMSK